MGKELLIQPYDESYQEKWDDFVLNNSANGTFLQTRNFLNYHPDGRFSDCSLLVLNGNNIVAVIPANLQNDDGPKTLCAHQGSTFGGIVVGSKFCKISYLDKIFEQFEAYIKNNGIEKVVMKLPGNIYQKSDTALLEYYLYMHGYCSLQEVGYYIDFNAYKGDIISNFSSSRRRDYKYSLRNSFRFKELNTREEIEEFYDVLSDNYLKFGKKPVHTLDELLEFMNKRLTDIIKFYGVYQNDIMIAGGMVFLFDKVFHTQYLAVRQNKKDLFANEFLYTNLIISAQNMNIRYLSFGTSTLEHGKVLNRPLAQFKEGFGAKEYVNRTYVKRFEGA